jgi:alpha-glucosidase
MMEQCYSWWQRGVLYQIYPLSFRDTDGDGRGDLPGILARLDYLTWLGVDAVWLGPIYRSPMADFGYDVADFTDVDPRFGALADLDRLLDALHARDIRLILDFVPNHTSHVHPWFVESRASRDSPKRDWYVWADPGPSGGPPNNWRSRFGGSAWEWDAATGQYYYHAFLKEQPDLNWRNPQVRAAMAEVLRFWLRCGVDGFRIDAAAVLAEDEQLRDEPPDPDADDRTPPPERLKRVYTNYQPEVLDWLAELRCTADEFPDRVLLGEVEASGDQIADFCGDGRRPILHLPLNYRLLDTPWDARALAAAIEAYLGALPPHAWPDWVLGSHDKTRLASVVGEAQARVAAMLLLTLPGTPIFFAGDELGLRDVPVPSAESRDPFERYVPGYGLNRDPERAPMPWDVGANAGFTTGTPWLPVAEDSARRNVAVERAERRSILQLYRRLIALRHAQPALAVGEYRMLPVSHAMLSYARRHADRRLLVVLNVGAEPHTYDLTSIGSGRVLLSTHLDRGGEALRNQAALRSHEGLVITLD